MRKEVKLGMAIGGGLIALLAVYLLIAPAGNNNRKGAQLTSGNPAGTVDGSQTGEPGGLTEAPSPVANSGASDNASPRSTDPWTVVHTGRGTPTPAPTTAPSAQIPRETTREIAAADRTSNTPATPAPARTITHTDPHAAWGGGVSTDAVFGSPSTPKSKVISNEPLAHNPTAATYEIKQGDTFSSIAAQVYGKASLFKEIVKANPNVNPNALRPGQTINLPSHETINSTKTLAASGSPANTTTSEIKIDPARQYQVKQGDSLYRISLNIYGKSTYVDKIYEKNKALIGSDPKKLKLGMILELPEKSETPTSATPANTGASTVTTEGPSR